jgi:hypothetical protein
LNRDRAVAGGWGSRGAATRATKGVCAASGCELYAIAAPPKIGQRECSLTAAFARPGEPAQATSARGTRLRPTVSQQGSGMRATIPAPPSAVGQADRLLDAKQLGQRAKPSAMCRASSRVSRMPSADPSCPQNRRRRVPAH